MEKSQEVLKAVHLELNRKDMIVLGALLKAQNNPDTYVDFKTLREQLELDEGGRKGKDSLIYRSLSWLEQTGLIKVDRSEHKHGYNSGVALMSRVMKRIIKERISALAKDLLLLDKEIQLISDMDSEVIAAHMVARATGAQPLEKPVFAQGWQSIQKLLDTRIYQNLEKNDVIRYTLEWYDQPEEAEEPRAAKLESLLKRGIELRGLEHGKGDKKRFHRLAEYYKYYRQMGYKVGLRMRLREDSTYQFVARNSEGIVLIVSESPLSATWFPRSANRELVDDAIQSFDRDYAEGLDISILRG